MRGRERGRTQELLDTQYQEASNGAEIEFSMPLARMTTECIELRDSLGISQTQLADRMGTKQSVISRFENLDGRLPSYDFLARLAAALGHPPGMTLFGDFMAVVPLDKHELVRERAEREGISTQSFLERLILRALSHYDARDFRWLDFANAADNRFVPSADRRGGTGRVESTESERHPESDFARAG